MAFTYLKIHFEIKLLMYTNLSVTSNFDSLVLVPGIMQVGGLGERQFTSEIISNVGGGG